VKADTEAQPGQNGRPPPSPGAFTSLRSPVLAGADTGAQPGQTGGRRPSKVPAERTHLPQAPGDTLARLPAVHAAVALFVRAQCARRFPQVKTPAPIVVIHFSAFVHASCLFSFFNPAIKVLSAWTRHESNQAGLGVPCIGGSPLALELDRQSRMCFQAMLATRLSGGGWNSVAEGDLQRSWIFTPRLNCMSARWNGRNDSPKVTSRDSPDGMEVLDCRRRVCRVMPVLCPNLPFHFSQQHP